MAILIIFIPMTRLRVAQTEEMHFWVIIQIFIHNEQKAEDRATALI